jgi:hypothetical protein
MVCDINKVLTFYEYRGPFLALGLVPLARFTLCLRMDRTLDAQQN